MQTLTLFALLACTAVYVDASVAILHLSEVFEPQSMENGKLRHLKHWVLKNEERPLRCRMCKSVFRGVARDVKNPAKVSKGELATQLSQKCHRVGGLVTTELCNAMIPASLHAVHEKITQSKKINPEHMCKELKLCHKSD